MLRVKIIEFITSTHLSLALAPSLEPGKRINKIFTDLVSVCTIQCTHQEAADILADPAIRDIVPSLQALCAKGEFLLEVYWAKRLARAPRLQDFTNFRNYDLLVQLEAHCLKGVGAAMNKMVFIGSGPLPLTSLLFAPHIQDSIVNLDRCLDAISISKTLTRALRLDHKVRFHHGEALEYRKYGDADIIVLAALVGANPDEKRAMVKNIACAMKPGAILMVRSTHRLRSLLYTPVPHIVDDNLEPLVELHPNNEVINSIIVFQKK